MKRLSDFPGFLPVAETLGEISATPKIEIWYQKDEYARNLMLGITTDLDPNNLEKTHVLLGTIGGLESSRHKHTERPRLLDLIYVALQGENWSPAGEARELIESKGLSHTSMCTGDAIRFVNSPFSLIPFDTYFLHFSKGWQRL